MLGVVTKSLTKHHNRVVASLKTIDVFDRFNEDLAKDDAHLVEGDESSLTKTIAFGTMRPRIGRWQVSFLDDAVEVLSGHLHHVLTVLSVVCRAGNRECVLHSENSDTNFGHLIAVQSPVLGVDADQDDVLGKSIGDWRDVVDRGNSEAVFEYIQIACAPGVEVKPQSIEPLLRGRNVRRGMACHLDQVLLADISTLTYSGSKIRIPRYLNCWGFR